ncbi:MAG: homocysteine S-methyltransferase family protein [Terriglobia bacterium]|jgi:5-methyltetrahydrofolate--homocysteine methyltransferase
MKSLTERLAQGDILISDGAMGTFLQARGLQPGECPEDWCISRPEVVKEIHEAYLAAGADILETNSFGGTSYKLRPYGLADRVRELNLAAVALAKQVIAGKGYVAAAVGPTGRIVEEEGGDAAPNDLYEAFKEQVTALAEGGADALCIETMGSLTEALQAVKAAKDSTALPVMCTFTFQAGARGFRTMMGVTPERAAREAAAAGADIVGSNCGSGIANMIEITRQMRAAEAHTPILVNANAGMPVLEEGKTVFKETPEFMASKIGELIAAGAQIIGGCCGTTPAHIAAIAERVKAKG